MGVYIKGMKMPTGNDEVRLIIHSNGQVIISHKTHYEEAEAVPVPPHGDLVDKQRMAETNEQHYKIFEGEPEADYAREVVLRMLDQAPTIIPAEEVET